MYIYEYTHMYAYIYIFVYAWHCCIRTLNTKRGLQCWGLLHVVYKWINRDHLGVGILYVWGFDSYWFACMRIIWTLGLCFDDVPVHIVHKLNHVGDFKMFESVTNAGSCCTSVSISDNRLRVDVVSFKRCLAINDVGHVLRCFICLRSWWISVRVL